MDDKRKKANLVDELFIVEPTKKTDKQKEIETLVNRIERDSKRLKLLLK